MSARALSSALPIVLTLGDVSCASSDREALTGAAPAAVVGDDGPETDAPAPPSSPLAAEPGATVREVGLADRRIRVELSPEASMHHDTVNDIVTFELGSQQTVQLKWKAGPAPETGTPEVTVVATLVGLPETFRLTAGAPTSASSRSTRSFASSPARSRRAASSQSTVAPRCCVRA